MRIYFCQKKALEKDLTIRILIAKVEELSKRVRKLERENAMLRQQNILLKSEVAGLKSRLASDSHNSNKPPSSNGYKKQPIRPGLPKDKNRSLGG